MLTIMTNNRFDKLVNLMLLYRRHFKSIYQEYSTTKKENGFIIAEVYDTSSSEIETILKEGFGCCIFSAETHGYIELWLYDLTNKL